MNAQTRKCNKHNSKLSKQEECFTEMKSGNADTVVGAGFRTQLRIPGSKLADSKVWYGTETSPGQSELY